MPVGNGYMRCMAERMVQVGWNLGVVAQTRDQAANLMQASREVDANLGQRPGYQAESLPSAGRLEGEEKTHRTTPSRYFHGLNKV
ncbi:hypothetical protein Taro_036605 [Colocasia esculenta]|uniref:Uncharacterized protein n=1 Tax=Colocasia esculenta TaxID=4460 RepID=A0A843WM57_COLES|nr:hypothetical protein [Colocasia esculenta]